MAAAQIGWRERELFAPGRVALTPALGYADQRGRLRAFAQVKAPLMLAVKRAASVEDAVRVRSLAASVVLMAGLATSLGRFDMSVSPWFVWDLVPAAVLRDQRDARGTFSVVPEVAMRVTEHFAVAAQATVFVAGALHGFPSWGLTAEGRL